MAVTLSLPAASKLTCQPPERADVARTRDRGGRDAVQLHVREHHVHVGHVARRPAEREVAAPENDRTHLVDAVADRAEDDMFGIGRGDECTRRADVLLPAADADSRVRWRLLVAQHQRNGRVMAERAFPVAREYRSGVDVGETAIGVEVVRMEPKRALAHGDAAAQPAECSLGVRRKRRHRERGVHDGEGARPRLEQAGAAQRVTPCVLIDMRELKRVALAHVHAHLRTVAVEGVAVRQPDPLPCAHDDRREPRPLSIHEHIH